VSDHPEGDDSPPHRSTGEPLVPADQPGGERTGPTPPAAPSDRTQAEWAAPGQGQGGQEQQAGWAAPGQEQQAEWAAPAGWVPPRTGEAGWAGAAPGGGGEAPEQAGWARAVGPPPPPGAPRSRPALLRTPALLSILLAVLLAIAGLGWYLTDRVAQQVGDLGDLERLLDEAEPDQGPPQVRRTLTEAAGDGDFTVTLVQVLEDRLQGLELRAEVAYDGDEDVLADLVLELTDDGDPVASGSPATAVPFAPGDRRTVVFTTDENYPEDYDSAELTVEATTGTPVEVVEGSQTVGDLTFSDIRVVEDAAGEFQVDATVTHTGGTVVPDATLLATVRADGETLSELSSTVTLAPDESRSVSFIGFDDHEDFDEVVFDADIESGSNPAD